MGGISSLKNVRKDELPMKKIISNGYLAYNSKFELLDLLPSVVRVAKVTIRRSLKVLRLLQVEVAN